MHVERVVDVGERRGPLQQKVGAGISTEAFAEKKAAAGGGHIGLRESLLMVARGLGWSLDAVEETLTPVTADRTIETAHSSVAEGDVAGIHHAAAGIVDGTECLTFNLQMYVGAQDPRDTVEVQGEPPIDLSVEGGFLGIRRRSECS